jgi:prepilin-type N-terminal cleavage/methylation domain-containing protein
MRIISNAGFTLLEVLIAFLIFALSIAGIFRIVIAGDMIHARAKALSQASLLASSEAERIRAAGSAGEKLQDSTYEQTVENTVFEVRRKVLESAYLPDGGTHTREVSIIITRQSNNKIVGNFRAVQRTAQ